MRALRDIKDGHADAGLTRSRRRLTAKDVKAWEHYICTASLDVAPYKKSAYSSLFQPAFIMSQYPVPPPSYGSTSPSPKSPNAPLFSGSRYQGEPGPSAGIYNQPAPGDLPDDFKVRLS
jgi:hypothetical protein